MISGQVNDNTFGFGATLNQPYAMVLERIPAVLKAHGFGVLTQIDVQDTLKQKLGVDIQRYVIFGACNPPLAYRALQAEPQIGLLLPCNVIVYESDHPNETVVSIIDPLVMMKLSDNAVLTEIATEAHQRLQHVLAELMS